MVPIPCCCHEYIQKFVNFRYDDIAFIEESIVAEESICECSLGITKLWILYTEQLVDHNNINLS